MMAARFGFGSPGGNYFGHFAKGFSSWESINVSPTAQMFTFFTVENCRAVFSIDWAKIIGPCDP